MNTDRHALPIRLSKSTIYIMVLLMKSGYREANKIFAGQRLRLMHYAAVAYLEVKSVSQKELATFLQMDVSDIVTLLDDLENEGYLVRKVDPQDRRRHILALTAKGNRWLKERDVLADHFDTTFFSALSEKEKENLRTYLLKIIT